MLEKLITAGGYAAMTLGILQLGRSVLAYCWAHCMDYRHMAESLMAIVS